MLQLQYNYFDSSSSILQACIFFLLLFFFFKLLLNLLFFFFKLLLNHFSSVPSSRAAFSSSLFLISSSHFSRLPSFRSLTADFLRIEPSINPKTKIAVTKLKLFEDAEEIADNQTTAFRYDLLCEDRKLLPEDVPVCRKCYKKGHNRYFCKMGEGDQAALSPAQSTAANRPSSSFADTPNSIGSEDRQFNSSSMGALYGICVRNLPARSSGEGSCDFFSASVLNCTVLWLLYFIVLY